MKRNLFVLFFLLILSGPAMAADTTVITICESKAVAASGAYTSAALDVKSAEGYFSIQAQIKGAGTATIGYQVSNDGQAWALPEGATAPLTGIKSTSGPGANGRVMEQFSPEFARYIRFYISETGGASSVLVTLKIAYR